VDKEFYNLISFQLKEVSNKVELMNESLIKNTVLAQEQDKRFEDLKYNSTVISNKIDLLSDKVSTRIDLIVRDINHMNSDIAKITTKAEDIKLFISTILPGKKSFVTVLATLVTYICLHYFGIKIPGVIN